MRCPVCGERSTHVKDSRLYDSGVTIRRKRECNACGKRFVTFEKIDKQPLIVIKQDGSKVTFSKEKLLESIMIALNKRPIEMSVIIELVNEIIHDLESKYNEELSSEEIGSCVMAKLKIIDSVAYIRYISVHKSFDNVQDFINIAREIEEQEFVL